ncbi:PD-(D/E)XK nuclease family protein [Lacihabitans sp. LS3-19]|uniref:PD-(D/E)XK nuclease family protein n=1 Tax=Lacihabitans sp. LS3-19 TaxID=2487335 RepID=UPI0020CD7715|nr:PD-(D/E)XK nuclease family protein [Lacihabitans sp. LS3-19]MCP9768181.1 PD-(D/E)XK nuclease family protein [Lacihabitans sp. LS3-19]
MQAFLDLAAQTIFEKHPLNELQQVQVILPSRRAVFFFKKALSNFSELPFFAPKIDSVDDFILDTSGLQTLDNVDLYFEIFNILKSVDPNQSFEKFMTWVPTLLKDFENVDFSLVENPHLLFKYMSEAEAISRWELDQDFAFTPTAQNYFSFFDKISVVYDRLSAILAENKKCYRGMVYRKVAENPDWILQKQIKKFYFVGLNALSRAEGVIIENLVKAKKAECIWDTDDYYMNSQNKAGKKLRAYKKTGKYGEWNFQNDLLKTCEKKINIFELNNESLQVKLVNNLINKAKGQRHVVVVLDENQFLPLVLNIPSLDVPFNISIGLPINNSIFSEVINLIIESFQYQNSADISKLPNYTLRKIFNNSVFKHFLIEDLGEAAFEDLVKKVNKSKKTFFEKEWFSHNGYQSEVINVFFSNEGVKACIGAIEDVLERFFVSENSIFPDIEFVFANALKSKLNIIKEKVKEDFEINLKSFKVLINELIKNERVPFEGDSDTALQIMSMLETRCLDFENVTILSFNEGNLPSAKKTNSFFPFDASKFFDLPLYSDNDAIMAYHFFRLMQRAEKINFIYLISASENLGNKEKSRFIRQIEEELAPLNANIKVNYPSIEFLNTDIEIHEKEIIITKDEKIIALVDTFFENKNLSASSINDFFQCSLKFYWKYLEKIRNDDEVKQHIGTDVFGTIVHKVLENLDKPIINNAKVVDKGVLEQQRKSVLPEIGKALNEYRLEHDFENGLNVILVSVVSKIIDAYFKKRIEEFVDTFQILALEKELLASYKVGETSIKIKGFIDKIEWHSSGMKVVDYKTGKVENSEIGTEKQELIDLLLNPKKGKLRQLILYFYLIYSNLEILEKEYKTKIELNALELMIYSLRNLKSDLVLKKDDLLPSQIIEATENMLTEIFEDLKNTEIAFKQTEDINACTYCEFINVCQR